MDHLRRPSAKQSARQASGAAEDEEYYEDPVVDDAPLHDTLLIRKDMTDCIRGLVNDLPEHYRTVLVLADLEGFTNAEIGVVLGTSLDTVKIRLHRARLRLKKAMDQACHLYHDERNELSCDRKPAKLALKLPAASCRELQLRTKSGASGEHGNPQQIILHLNPA